MKCKVCGKPTKQKFSGEWFETCFEHSGKPSTYTNQNKNSNKEEIMNALRIIYQETQDIKNLLMDEPKKDPLYINPAPEDLGEGWGR